MHAALDQIYRILQQNTTESLPDDVVEVCKLTPEQYTAIRKTLAPADQQELDAAYTVAERNVQLVTEVSSGTKGDLIGAAIKGLLIIRGFQNSGRLLEGLAPSIDRDFLQIAHDSIPEGQRRDVVANVLSVIEQLPHASEREAAVTLLATMRHPANRQGLLPNVVPVAKLCRKPTDIHNLKKFLKLLNADDYLDLRTLHTLLSKAPADDWHRIYKAVKPHGSAALAEFSSLLESLRQINVDELLELYNVVLLFMADRERVHAAAPLLALCDEGSHAAAIVRDVAELDPQLRRVTVEITRDSFVSSTDSSIVHEALIQQMQFNERQGVMQRVVQALMGMAQMQDVEEFIVDSEDLGNCPHTVLQNFIEFVEAGNTNPRLIGFIGNETRGPGIAKEFLHKLVRGVCTKLGCTQLDDGCMRPEKDNLGPEEEAVYSNLGRLFMYCMKNELVIGMQLDPGLFCALAELTEDHLNFKINDKTFKLFWTLYAQMKKFYPSDRQSVDSMQLAIDEQFTRDVLMEAMPKAIEPAIAIRRGMEIPEGIKAEQLERLIQGTVTARDILNAVQFDHGITEHNRPIIEAWIRDLDSNPQKLKKFLTVVTGAPGLGPKPIIIEISGVAIQAHHCAQHLSLPGDITIQEALEELDKSLDREV